MKAVVAAKLGGVELNVQPINKYKGKVDASKVRRRTGRPWPHHPSHGCRPPVVSGLRVMACHGTKKSWEARG